MRKPQKMTPEQRARKTMLQKLRREDPEYRAKDNARSARRMHEKYQTDPAHRARVQAYEKQPHVRQRKNEKRRDDEYRARRNAVARANEKGKEKANERKRSKKYREAERRRLSLPEVKTKRAKSAKETSRKIVASLGDSYIAARLGLPVDLLRGHLPNLLESKRQEMLLKREISIIQKQLKETHP
jgi:hypothetical protein